MFALSALHHVPTGAMDWCVCVGGGLWAQIPSPQKSPGGGALCLGHEARGLASHLCVPTGGAAVLASQMLRPAAPGLGSSHVDSRVFPYLEAARRYYRYAWRAFCCFRGLGFTPFVISERKLIMCLRASLDLGILLQLSKSQSLGKRHSPFTHF